MRITNGSRGGWAAISNRFRLLYKKPFCTNNKPTAPSDKINEGGTEQLVDGSLSTHDETYRQLDKLDFVTAARILFTTPPKNKKFGIDFHLVQFFFACMPSLAVYLVAQYARYEMRRMEAEQEVKRKAEEEKKAEEEAKAKEVELNASEGIESGSDPELLQVKVRLDKLEETLKEIVVESKKQQDFTSTKNQEDGSKKIHHTATDHTRSLNRLEASDSKGEERFIKQKSENVASNSSLENVAGSAGGISDAS